MKFIITPLLLFATTAIAQKIPPRADSSKTVIAALPFTHADSVRALHNLFKSRRNTGSWLTGASGGIIAVTSLVTLADNNGQGRTGFDAGFDTGGTSLFFGTLLAPVWIPGTVTLFRFTKKREQNAVAEFERTRKLPHYLRRKLARRFFNTNYRFSKPN